MSPLENPWVVNIGTGLISGLVIFIVTIIYNKYSIPKRAGAEYKKSLKIANNDLLFIVRPLTASASTISLDIMESVSESIARRHEVERVDLLNTQQLLEDLIREILDNPFLPPEQRFELSRNLETLKTEAIRISTHKKIVAGLNSTTPRNTKLLDLINVTSAVAATTAGLVIALSGEFTKRPDIKLDQTAILITLSAILGTITSTTILTRSSKALSKILHLKKDIEPKDTNPLN